jgi:Tfp pilus assembly protein FimT
MPPARRPRAAGGFTAVELLIVAAIGALLCASALPSLADWRARQRLNDRALRLVNDVHQARALAVERHQTMYLAFHEACYTVAATPDCPCDAAGAACAVKTVALASGGVTSVPARPMLAFDPRFGSTAAGPVARLSLGGRVLDVDVEAVGHAQARPASNPGL